MSKILEAWYAAIFNVLGYLAIWLMTLPTTLAQYWFVLVGCIVVFGAPALWNHSLTPYLWPIGVLGYVIIMLPVSFAVVRRFPNG